MTLLGGPWQLRDVDDVEGFARTVLQRELTKLGAGLRPHARDDAVAYLLAAAWKAHLSYDAGKYRSWRGHRTGGSRYSQTDIASELGISQRSVSNLLDELRDELTLGG